MIEHDRTQPAPAHRGKDKPTRWSSLLGNLPAQLALLFAFVLALIWAGIIWQLRYAHDQIIQDAERDRENLARAFAEEVRVSVRSIDLVLLSLREEWRHHDPGKFQEAVQHQQNYFTQSAGFQVYIVGTDGKIAYSNHDPGLRQASLAGEECFRIHAGSSVDTLFISKPATGFGAIPLSIQFTRPILDPQRGFLGVIVLSVAPEYLSRFYDTLDLGSDGMVSVIRSEGAILAHVPHMKQSLGKSLAGRPFTAPDAADIGSYRVNSMMDGVNRVFTWRKLEDLGLTVVVGESIDSMLASYYLQQRGFIFGGIAGSGLLLFFGATIVAGWRRRERAASALAASEVRNALQAAALNAVGNGAVITNTDAVIEWVNPAFESLTGYSSAEVIGKTPAILKSGRQDRGFYEHMWHCISEEGHWQGEIWNRRKNGEIYPEWLVITAVKDNAGHITHYVGAFSDITQRKLDEAQIRTLAFYDPLTGLPNRRLLADRAAQVLAASARSRRFGALMMIDLDRFKQLNDTWGHDVGDELLEQVAKRLLACVRESDTVARFGGDEFVLLVGDLGRERQEAAGQADEIARKILESLNRPYSLAGLEQDKYHNTPSIGITLFRGRDASLEVLLKQADIALYKAKDAGRNTSRFYEDCEHCDKAAQ